MTYLFRGLQTTKIFKYLYVIEYLLVNRILQPVVNQTDKIRKLYVYVYMIIINAINPNVTPDKMQLVLILFGG